MKKQIDELTLLLAGKVFDAHGVAKWLIEEQGYRKQNESKWIEHYSFDVWHYDCPFCDDGYATRGLDTTPPNFCSNCGARLSGVKSMEDNHD